MRGKKLNWNALLIFAHRAIDKFPRRCRWWAERRCVFRRRVAVWCSILNRKQFGTNIVVHVYYCCCSTIHACIHTASYNFPCTDVTAVQRHDAICLTSKQFALLPTPENRSSPCVCLCVWLFTLFHLVFEYRSDLSRFPQYFVAHWEMCPLVVGRAVEAVELFSIAFLFGTIVSRCHWPLSLSNTLIAYHRSSIC